MSTLTKYTVTDGVTKIEYANIDAATGYCVAHGIDPANITTTTVNVNADTFGIIASRLAQYKQVAPQLLTSIEVQNVMSGITTAQSAQVFTDYNLVLNALREGAFPTAIYLLNQIGPLGFVDSALLAQWIATIQAAL